MIITGGIGADIDFKCLLCISDISDKIGVPKPPCFTGSEYNSLDL